MIVTSDTIRIADRTTAFLGSLKAFRVARNSIGVIGVQPAIWSIQNQWRFEMAGLRGFGTEGRDLRIGG